MVYEMPGQSTPVATPPATPVPTTPAAPVTLPVQPTPHAAPSSQGAPPTPDKGAAPTSVLDRVAATKLPGTPGEPPAIDPYEVAGFNREDISKITDPTARQYVENMAKSFESGFTKKFQSLAEERKQLETTQAQPRGWTLDRLNAELQNPEFVRVAQQAMAMRGTNPNGAPAGNPGGLTDDEYSQLNTKEQAALTASAAQANKANAGVTALHSELQAMRRQTEDTALQGKYASYNAAEVDHIYNGMIDGSIQATREHLWKVTDYDNAVQRAYDMGRTDERGGITEKHQVSSPAGVVTSQVPSVPPKEQNESGPAYFKRLAIARQQQFSQARPANQ